MTTEVVTLESLRAKARVAVDAGNDNELLAITKQMSKLKTEIAAAEAKRLADEATALATVRTEATEKLDKLIRVRDMQRIINLAESVKAIGLHYTVSFADNSVSIGFDYQQAPKAVTKRASGGGGGNRQSNKEFGMSLNDIFEKFATAEDKVKLEEAGKVANRPDSAQYTVKLAVKKTAIAAGLLKPVS